MTARFSVLVPIVLFGFVGVTFTQTVQTKGGGDDTANQPSVVVDSKSTSSSPPKSGSNFLRNIARDQKSILSSPFRVKREDLKWLVPFAAATTALLLTDRRTSSWISRNGTLSSASHATSYAGSIYSTAGFAAGLYFIGKGTGPATPPKDRQACL